MHLNGDVTYLNIYNGLLDMSDHDPYSEEGSPHFRLRLDPGIDVAVRIREIGRESFLSRMAIPKKHITFNIALCNGQFKRCELNIRSLMKHLRLSRSEVLDIGNHERGFEILQRIANVRTRSMDKIKEILSNCDVVRGKLRVNGVPLHLQEKRLHNIVESAVKSTLDSDSNPELVALKSFKLYGKRYFVEHVGEEAFNIFSSRLLGGGGSGKVYRVTNMVTGDQYAIKKAKKKVHQEPNPRPLETLIHEANTLRRINPRGDVEGIQSPPFFPADNGMYMARLYGGDLVSVVFSFQRLPIAERLELCRELLSGLRYLHEVGYVHGDIKPDNCLVEIDEEGGLKHFVIGDFGGAQAAGSIGSHWMRTLDYLPPDISVEIMDDIPMDCVIESCDVYAMSKTLIQMLVGMMPHTLIDYTNYQHFRARLLSVGVPGNVAEVLMNGMASYTIRLESDQLYAQFCNAIEYSDLKY